MIAFVIGFPLQWIVTPKTYHSINVWAARALNIPLILLVAAWERREVFTARWQRTRLHHYFQRILIRTTAHQAVRIAFHLPAELLVGSLHCSSLANSLINPTQADIPINGTLDNSDSETSSVRRGRSASPKRRGRGTALMKREGSKPSPLTRMYGRGDQDFEALVKRMERLEEMLGRIEDGVKAIG